MKIISPKNKQVFQRDNEGLAPVRVQIETTEQVNIIVKKGDEVVKTLSNLQPQNGKVIGSISLSSGLYVVELQTQTDKKTIRFGVGEVFAIYGHSFTEGFNSEQSLDENIIIPDNLFSPMEQADLYQNTGYISLKDISKYTLKTYESQEQIDYAQKTGIWSWLGNILVKTYQCPIMFLNGGFGGSTLEQGYNVINKIPFGGGFVNYEKRMPIVKLENMLKYIVPETGIRSVICIHGDNDKSQKYPQSDVYKFWASNIANFRSIVTNLNFVICPSITELEKQESKDVLNATLQVIAEIEGVTKGSDIYKFDNNFRKADQLHLSYLGEQRAAQEIASVVGTKEYLLNFKPTIPVYLPALEKVQTLVESKKTIETKDVVYLSIIAFVTGLLVKRLWS